MSHFSRKLHNLFILTFFCLFLQCFTHKTDHIHATQEEIHSTPNCPQLVDILEEDKIELYEELIQCQVEQHKDCQVQKDSYLCRKLIHNIFFSKDFNSYDYGYAKKRFNLLRVLVNKGELLSLNDPDFLNNLIFSKFFNYEGFEVILQEIEKNSIQLTPLLQFLNLLHSHLSLKYQIDQEIEEDIQKAINLTKCYSFEQFLNIYKITTFTLNGKFQFDWYFYYLQKSTNHNLLDKFVSFMNNNVFTYQGPQELTGEEIKKANVQIFQQDLEKIDIIAKEVRENVLDEKLKGQYSIQSLSKLFIDSITQFTRKEKEEEKSLESSTYPIYFGSYDFKGFQTILKLLISHDCDTQSIMQFSEYLTNQVYFVDENQKQRMIKLIDSYLEQRNKDLRQEIQKEKEENKNNKSDL